MKTLQAAEPPVEIDGERLVFETKVPQVLAAVGESESAPYAGSTAVPSCRRCSTQDADQCLDFLPSVAINKR